MVRGNCSAPDPRIRRQGAPGCRVMPALEVVCAHQRKVTPRCGSMPVAETFALPTSRARNETRSVIFFIFTVSETQLRFATALTPHSLKWLRPPMPTCRRCYFWAFFGPIMAKKLIFRGSKNNPKMAQKWPKKLQRCQKIPKNSQKS